MALAISELMLSREDWTPEGIAEGFVRAFKRDPRRGYSSKFYEILRRVDTGRELVETLQPGSDRNGAAMRAFPIGLYADVAEVLEKADMQARITHDTPVARRAAQAVALMAHGLCAFALPKKITALDSHQRMNRAPTLRPEQGSRAGSNIT